ncbi:helix-turn-helix transcriptional regulator [Enterovibrio norvegicus]|uniref:helix-turn-helix transcriptional regulator n=1 Tax=Enterovibrio norvegicus TaxID=188144 RepID=UPI000C82F5AC|nr:hypothetical protein BCT27_01780 [Enterovibrio norvegicus]
MSTPNLLNPSQACQMLGVSLSTLYRHVQKGLIPSSINLAPRSKAWLVSEIESILEARYCGYSDAEIAKFVGEIISNRKKRIEGQFYGNH